MANRRLFIDGDDQGHFFLAVETGTLTIGGDPKNGLLRTDNASFTFFRQRIV
jgi:hypothetical protein